MGRDLHYYVIENEEDMKEYEDPEVFKYRTCIYEASNSGLPYMDSFYTTEQIAELLREATSEFMSAQKDEDTEYVPGALWWRMDSHNVSE